MDPRTPLFMYRLQHSPTKADRLIRERLGAAAPAKIGPKNRAALLDRVFGTTRYVTPAVLVGAGKVKALPRRLRAPAMEEVAIAAPEGLGRASQSSLRVVPIEELLGGRAPRASKAAGELGVLEAVRRAVVDALPKGDRARREMSSKSKSNLNKAIALMDKKVEALGGKRTELDLGINTALGSQPHNREEMKEDIHDALEVIEEASLGEKLKDVVAALNAALK